MLKNLKVEIVFLNSVVRNGQKLIALATWKKLKNIHVSRSNSRKFSLIAKKLQDSGILRISSANSFIGNVLCLNESYKKQHQEHRQALEKGIQLQRDANERKNIINYYNKTNG